jgi:Rrf2 family transcriptional regulator, iron-sulfur cluster assembly transcription factor
MSLDRLPSEPVEDEEHHRFRIQDARGHPRRRPAAHESWYQTRDRRPAVVRPYRVHRLRLCARRTQAGAWLRDHGPVKVSTRGDYAARALLSLALHGEDRPTSVKEIAERTSLPQPYLEQILLAVKGAGLVQSKRGVGGGYVLARSPEKITLAEIIAAVEGPLTTLMGEHDHCEGHCVLQEVWVCVSEETRQLLEGFTLAELVERTRIGHAEAAVQAR